MKTSVKVWIIAMILFWSTFVATFLVDYLGLIETTNMGYVETVWISWMLSTLVLGIATAIAISYVSKE